MSTELLVILLVIIAGFGIFYYLIKQQLTQNKPEELDNLINQIFGKSVEKITAQSKQVLQAEKEAIKSVPEAEPKKAVTEPKKK